MVILGYLLIGLQQILVREDLRRQLGDRRRVAVVNKRITTAWKIPTRRG